MFLKLLLTILPAWLAISAETVLPVGSKVPAWSLQDVKDVRYDAARFSGRKLLIVGGDKSSQQENERWGERAMKTCGNGLTAVGVADVSSAPRFLRSRVKNQFRNSEPSRPSARLGVPLLLDWDGSMARSFHFIQKVPNVFLVGSDGVLRFAASGPVTEKALNQLCNAVNAKAPGE